MFCTKCDKMPVLLYQTKSKMYILRGENNLIDKIEYPEIVKKKGYFAGKIDIDFIVG